ncbi:nucleoporin NUP188-like isoform X2 [Mya arenaria]|uniref:nucleoporin NUP188-like isoform X2 n=1 Tax=Mya arenaria TaxID=6604 RepID=UPI0022E78702|nr:nucleoporin NUP188-like isoform X2 [Mya arenaria]
MAGSPVRNRKESFGNRNLWQYVSGTGILRPKELIKRELVRNREKLLNGILFYKKPSVPQGEALKSKKLSTQQKEFIEKLTPFLGLDEAQSYEIFCSYIYQDFRGSQKNLQLCLSSERHMQGLMLKIRDFYYSERLYLLQTIRHILTFWPEQENHPYREEYTEFLNELLNNNELIKRLLDQLDGITDAPPPSWETHGKLMNERHALVWAQQNLKEQVELLEILLVYWKDFEASAADFTKLLDKFKRQGFGRRQSYKHILDEHMDSTLKQIGSLEVLVLLQALDLETVERLSTTQSFGEHSLLKDQSTFQSVDQAIQLLGTEQPHGPLLLSWSVVRQLYLDNTGSQLTRKFGNQALQLHVFDFINEVLSREPFSGKSMTASVSHCLIYTVLLAALTAFDETTLTRNHMERQVLYDITAKLMDREFIAMNVWNKGLDVGVGSLFQTALLNFPLDFTTLVRLSTALATANENSASRVLELWSELPRYTEYLDRNSSQDIRPTTDNSVWQLARDKTPYASGDFQIPAGVYGQLITVGRKSDLEIPIIQWEVTYNGWELLKGEIQELLHQIAHGAGMVGPVQIQRVTEVSMFVRAVCRSQPEATKGLSDILTLLYTVIHRFSSFSPAPLELLAACVDCVTCAAKLQPQQAWHDLKHTGLLPFLTENIDNMAELLSGKGVSRGLYGSLLAGSEVPHGNFLLTEALLDFISELVLPLYKVGREDQLQACMVYILREVFPAFQKWRYLGNTRKEIIGQKCLGIAHKILNLQLSKEKKNASRPHIQQLCVYSLLFTEAGKSLLEIIATGVETVEILLAQQSSQSEGSGDDLVQLIQMAFSVMNRLLLLRSHEQLSPVEVALSSQPAGYQNQHIVAVIAEYIYHRTSPKLARLATLFLRRLAVVLPMSILACLGSQAEALRDIFLMRLQLATEDLSLKTGILQLLSVCVDTQPGLIELFLNVQPSSQTDANKDGQVSCIQTVLELMDVGRQETYRCPPDLLAACTSFIQALWQGGRETAMEALRAKPNFWPSLCSCLLKDLPDVTQDKMLVHRMKTVAYTLRLLAHEIYSVTSVRLDDNLKKVFKELAEKGRLKYWSTYISIQVRSQDSVMPHDLSLEGTDLSDNPTFLLLRAWKDFWVVIAKIQVTELKLEEELKEVIVEDLLQSVYAQFSDKLTEFGHTVAKTCSALFFTLVSSWGSCLKDWKQLLDQCVETLDLSMTSGDMVIPSIQIGLLGTLSTLLQSVRTDHSKKIDMRRLQTILATVCKMLLQTTRELPSVQELKKLREGQDGGAGSFVNTDHRIKLQMVGCCTVDQLLHQIGSSDLWLPCLQEHMVLPALLSSAHMYLQGQESVHYMQTLFTLFITIAQHDKGGEALSLAGLTGYVCLPISYCYQNGDTSIQGPTPNKQARQTPQPVTWLGVYCQCVDLYTTLLTSLKFTFLEDAFNFVGSHQDRMQQCLECSRFNLKPEIFEEVERTCVFVGQLANYSREWRLHLPEPLNKILTSMLFMCQTFVSYLVRPRYLQYILEQGGEKQPGSRGGERFPVATLHTQASMEDVDNPSTQYTQVQHSLLKVIGESLVALRRFTPDLVQILVDQNMDVGEFSPLVEIGFSTPPVDHDAPPTFGTLLSCITIAIKMLSKLDGGRSPQRSDQASASSSTAVAAQQISKSLVMFVLENALYLTMSQGMWYLKDPRVHQRDKQLLKRELGTEMNSILSGIQRYIRRGGPQSPAGGSQPSPRGQSPGGPTLSRSVSQTFLTSHDHAVFRLVQEFSKQVLR